jgi:EmrB/QacA subfamily drug resistance transporter
MAVTTAPLSTTASDRRRWIALVVVCLAMLMNALDGSIVNVALPAIQRSLHFSQSGLTWVVDGYLISFGSFLLMAGRLGDLIGRKKVFLAGVGLFTLSSVVCGMANSQAMLIGARFVQGIGGAASASVIIAIIVTEFPRADERAKAMSAYLFVTVGGGSIGLLAGGVLTQAINWHWIFFVNVPIGIATLVLGRLLIVESVGLGIKQGVDVVGSVLVTISLMTGIYAIVTAATYGWGSTHTLLFAAIAVGLFTAFMVLESRLTNPIMPVRILKLRSLTGSSVIRGLIATGMFSTFFLGALYLERVGGYSPLRTGLAFLPTSLTMGSMSAGITARLVNRFGAKAVMYPGIAVTVIGLILLAFAGPHPHYFPQVFFAFFFLGLGAGSSFMPLTLMAMREVPNEDAGLAGGIVNVSMQMTAAVGLAVLSTVATNRSKFLLAHGHALAASLTDGFRLALIIAAACVLVGLALSPILLRSAGDPDEVESHGAELMKQPEAQEHLVL